MTIAPEVVEQFAPWPGSPPHSPDGIFRINGPWVGTYGNFMSPSNAQFLTDPGSSDGDVLALTVSVNIKQGAELQSLPLGVFGYGYYEASMKITSVSGVVDSFFTIQAPNYGPQEIDIEFLTNEAGFDSPASHVHFTLHPSGMTFDQPLSFNPTTSFHDYGFLWTPGEVQFTVDGTVVHTFTDPQLVITPGTSEYLMANTWTGNPNWGGGPPTQAATSEYDWIKYWPNVTTVPDGSGTSMPTQPPVTYFTPPIRLPSSGVIGFLNAAEQLEMVYVAYFNRAADSTGFNYWQAQYTESVAAGQSPDQVLANIADAFTPQPETFALYPFLSTPDLNLESPASLAGLTDVVTDIYGNLFDRAPDAAGLAYWVQQLSTGAIPLGEAVLAIANGAQGSDVTEVLNKITVALDFTTRTGAAGSLVNATATLVPAARGVLNGVDSTSLNDASVTAGENATTAYIADTSVAAASDPIVSTSNTVENLGAGSHTIRFIAGVSDDTVVLHSGGTDQIAGFSLAGGDVLDVRTLLAESLPTPQDVLPNPGAYFTIADQGADAVLLFDATGHGGGDAVAILDNLGSVVTSFSSLTSHHAVQI